MLSKNRLVPQEMTRSRTMYSSAYNDQKQFSRVDVIELMGIKCAQCDLIYKPEHIEEHLVTHIQPKYLMPNQPKAQAKKLSALLNMTEDTLAVSEDIPSLAIDEFPSQESIRKDIKPPSEFAIGVTNLPNLKKQLASYHGDQKDLFSRLGLNINGEEVEDRMQLTQNVDLNKEQASLLFNQSISLYRTHKNGLTPYKEKIRTEKKVNPFQQSSTDKSREYQILSVSSQQGHIGHSQQVDPSLLLVNIRKQKYQTPRRQQINTSAKKPRFTSQTRLTHRPQQDLTPTRYHNHNQCPQCHGFYCQHCKSTIPPVYRPWNLKEVDRRTADWYKQHVYKGKCQECEGGMR